MDSLVHQPGFASLFGVLGCIFCAATVSAATAALEIGTDDGTLSVRSGPVALVTYQARPMTGPVGGARFRGSAFLHPLRTPSGFVVTDLQPGDHLHHFGAWWPWKYLAVGGRRVLFWELQRGEGIIVGEGVTASGADETGARFTARNVYLDRTVEGAPLKLLDETVGIRVSPVTNTPARGYTIDLRITHRCAVNEPIQIVKYRYSGFGFRGTAAWSSTNSTLLTSEGRNREDSNGSRGRWVRLQGKAGAETSAGVLLMSDAANHEHPEFLRTWNSKMHAGAFFVNFNPVQREAWTFEPGRDYIRRYRLFVYDGEISAEQAEAQWAAWQTGDRKEMD